MPELTCLDSRRGARTMINDPKRAKEHIITRGVARRSRRRNQKGPYRPDPEKAVEILHRQRAEREAAVLDAKASGDWLQVSEIVSVVVAKKRARFDRKKKNRIKIEVCGDIVSDSAEGRLGTEKSPAIMLLSR